MKKGSYNFLNLKRSLICILLFLYFLSISSSLQPQIESQDENQEFIRLSGQSNTLLPDGRRLLIGGKGSAGPVASAIIWDERNQKTLLIPYELAEPRAWHSATVLPNGMILILGGVTTNDQVLGTAELFDPETLSFTRIASTIFTPRAHHTATLLTDGRVLIAGGISNNKETVGTVELWNAKSEVIQPVPSNLAYARYSHSAELRPDGNVNIVGGVDSRGQKISNDEVYNFSSNQFVSVNSLLASKSDYDLAGIAGSLPADDDINVPVDTIISIRFSNPMRVETINKNTIRLFTRNDLLSAKVVPAEDGRIVFITPKNLLKPNATYNLSIDGITDQYNHALAPTNLTFATVELTSDLGASDDEIWTPSGMENWKTNNRESTWQSLMPLQAPPGVTALAGQVLKLNGEPLQKVTLRIGKVSALTDETGRFLLSSVESKWQKLLIDGRTANTLARTYGVFEVGLKIKEKQTNALPYTIWMPLIDKANSVKFASPTTTEVVVQTPRVHGLEIRIPAGTIIRDREGKIVTEVSITPIPLDRTPFPLPENVSTSMYFTIQPDGAQLYGTEGAKIIFPNHFTHRAHDRFNLFRHDPGDIGWHIYGIARVAENELEISPDAQVRDRNLAPVVIQCAMGIPPDVPYDDWPGQCGEDGDPVDCQTGLYIERNVDLVVPDVLPIVVTRTYRSRDDYSRPFGKGGSHSYQLFLWSDNYYQDRDLVLPDGRRVHYVRISPGSGYEDAVFEQQNLQSIFYKSRIVWNGNGWDLTLKNGTVYVFGHNAPLQLIRDRYGNQLNITRSPAVTGQVTKITSPNGRWVEFAYASTNSAQITQIKDNLGRTVTYSNNMTKVTDTMGGVTEYTYDALYRMLTKKNPRGYTEVTNEYDANGRVFRQTRADLTTYQFTYKLNPQGKVIQTDITNPRGYVRRVTFKDNGYNADGYILTDTRALGTAVQQTTTYERENGTNLLLTITDQLGRKTRYNYEARGNTSSFTRLEGTAQAVTTTIGYEPTFNQVNSITDPLNHSLSISYDTAGNPATISDPLNNSVNLTFNSSGQALTVEDPLNNITQFTYTLGNLTGMILPLNRQVTRFVDGGGRPLLKTNTLGDSVHYEYDSLNRPTKIIDAIGGRTNFEYDANSNLVTLEDPRNKRTTYTYNNMDHVTTRTDPLMRTESYLYDNNGNLRQVNDRMSPSQITTYSYDPLDRLSQVQYHDGSTITYTYDAGNRLTQVVDSVSGTVTYAYDNLDRITSETTPQGNISYTYDNANRRITMTIAGQLTVNYTYDDADKLTQISQGSSAVTLTYDSAGRRTSVALPNGIKMEYNYNIASQLIEIVYKQGITVIGNLTYEYDLGGRRTKVGGSFSRTNLPPALNSATYNDANHQMTFGGQSLIYDNNGNLTNDGVNTYTYNARNQLVTMSGPQVMATFQYDAFGRRYNKNVNGVSTSFLFDGSNPVQEISGGIASANLFNGLSVDEYFMRTDTSGSRYFLTDAQKNTVALTDSNGTIQTQYTYEPFGKSTTSGSISSSSYQYTGRENDATGLVYYRARYYHPGLQRFVGEDPLGFDGGINFYSYVGNSPINFIDPWGLLKLKFDISEGLLYINPQQDGKKIYSIPVTSGTPGCINDPNCTDQEGGPIWPGNFEADLNRNELSDRTWMGDYLRNWGAGDWGDWRLRFDPMPGNTTPKGRTPGFYIHGGEKPGSYGCIDIGGGLHGNSITDKLKEEILADPDGKIQLYVVK